MELLIATVISFCQFKNANITTDNKEKCMEKIVNCAIIQDGKTTPQLIEKCKQKYAK